MMRVTLALVALALGCSPIPSPVPAPPPTSCSGNPAECACSRLCALGCTECRPNCAAIINHILADRLMVFSPECVASAPDVAAVRDCPSVECKQ